MKLISMVILLCILQTPAWAGKVILAWSYDLAAYPGVEFVLRGSSTNGREVVMDPLPTSQCATWPDPEPPQAPKVMVCGSVCLDVGAYSLTLYARREGQRSNESNVRDLDLQSTTACGTVAGPAPPPTPAPRPINVPPLPIPIPLPGETEGGKDGPNNLLSLINWDCVTWKITGPCMCGPNQPCVTVEYWEPGWLVETVKRSGDSTIPILGETLSRVLQLAGLNGGGGSGNATGVGHTNIQFSEAHVYTMPSLGGPCTGCSPNPLTMRCNYASELDSVAWRTAGSMLTPLDLLQRIGTWANLYPRGGKVITSSEPVAAGVVTVRAMDIVRQPIGTPPNVDRHIILEPANAGTPICMQMGSPRQLPCFPAGAPNVLWETATVSRGGRYVFVIWRKRQCCVNPSQAQCGITLNGGQGHNLCIIPNGAQ